MEDTANGGASIHEVLARHRDGWMERPEVVGTGVGRCGDAPCLVVYLRERSEAVEQAFPDTVEGYRVRLEETGAITPRDRDGSAPDREG